MKQIALLLLLAAFVSAVPSRRFEGTEILDSEAKYKLSWRVENPFGDDGRIFFEAEVETLGFVGLGISPNGKMDGADLYVAGVDANGMLYHMDAHGVGHSVVADTQRDWFFDFGTENATHTHLRFHRLLNTCDNEDYPITNDTSRLIWSYGEADELDYHGDTKGTSSINFLVPAVDDWDDSRYQKFDVTTQSPGVSDETMYWCTIHKGPEVDRKNHIVAFEANLNNALAKQYTHHVILMMCKAPEGSDQAEYFDKFIGHRGTFCYDPEDNFPVNECQEYLYVWAVGGKTSYFPENVGYPFGEDGRPIYYMLETHYNNPENVPDLQFETGVSIYYTNELREVDAGFLWHWHRTDPRLVIPPSVPDFVISTHCAPECTAHALPPEGITIFNVLLHSHKAGRKMKLRHFRGDIELPFIITDGHYDFDFQQNRNLIEPRVVLPGDQMTVECVFDSSDRNGTVISGGLSTREEMCEAIIWYYPKLPLSGCGSTYPQDKALREEYGVTNYTIERYGHEMKMPMIWAPEHLAGPNGTDFITMLNTKIEWTPEFMQFMRDSRQYGVHEHKCDIDGEPQIVTPVAYPDIASPYEPINVCLEK